MLGDWQARVIVRGDGSGGVQTWGGRTHFMTGHAGWHFGLMFAGDRQVVYWCRKGVDLWLSSLSGAHKNLWLIYQQHFQFHRHEHIVSNSPSNTSGIVFDIPQSSRCQQANRVCGNYVGNLEITIFALTLSFSWNSVLSKHKSCHISVVSSGTCQMKVWMSLKASVI